MVRPDRFELPTYWFVASCSIQLSYGRMCEAIPNISIQSMAGKESRASKANGASVSRRSPQRVNYSAVIAYAFGALSKTLKFFSSKYSTLPCW